MTDRRRATGARGESVAAAHLRERGYTIVTQNWRCGRGEIDIVAQEGTTLVFVEVRTRSSTALGTAEESVTHAKQQRLIQLAQSYLDERERAMEPWQGAWRIDVISLQVDRSSGRVLRFNHLPGAVEG